MIRVLDRSHENFFAFEVEGVVTKEELEELGNRLEKIIETYGTLHWMCVWKSLHYENLRAFYADMMWMFRHLKHFGRMAMVGDSWWKKLLVEADGLFFGEKYFDLSQTEDAWAYVEGK